MSKRAMRAAAVVAATILIGAGACASQSAAQDAPGKSLPDVEKYDAPYGFPAVITYCLHGTRLFQTWHDGGASYGGNSSIGFVARPDDPSCQR